MRAALLLLTFSLLAGAARAEQPAPVSGTDRVAIKQVIGAQLDAFRRDDAAAAFGYAAPNIHQMFGDPEHFIDMVKQAYQPVYRPRSVAFGDLVEDDDGEIVQKVELQGPDGQIDLALYTMEHEADGSWRIAGCTLAKSDKLAT
jgi:hypothetical protein